MEIFENLDFGWSFGKSQFWSKFLKNLSFGKKFLEIYILVEIFKNLDFGRNLGKSRFWSKFAKNLDFGRNLRKISVWVEIFDKSRFFINDTMVSFLNLNESNPLW